MSKKMLDQFKEQLTINGYLSDAPVRRVFKYQLYDDGHSFNRMILQPGERGLIGKFDWITLILARCSIKEFFNFLGISHLIDFDDEKVKQPFERDARWDDRIVFRWNNLDMSFSIYDNLDIDTDLFYSDVNDLRVDISGQGLDFLRSNGFDPENFFRNRERFSDRFGVGGWHFTRCDIAFDFVNFNENMIDKCISYARSNESSTGRLKLCGIDSPLVYQIYEGASKSFCVGSPASDRRLKIYDKRLEQIDPVTYQYKQLNPYSDPDSWIRMECVFRNKQADYILSTDQDFFDYLTYIFKKYPFKDTSQLGNVVHKFWRDIFYSDKDFNPLHDLFVNKNINFVQYITREEKIYGWAKKHALNLIEFKQFCHFNGFTVDEFINDELDTLQTKIDDSKLERKRQKRRRTLALRCMSHTYYNYTHDDIYSRKDNKIIFKDNI